MCRRSLVDLTVPAGSHSVLHWPFHVSWVVGHSLVLLSVLSIIVVSFFLLPDLSTAVVVDEKSI